MAFYGSNFSESQWPYCYEPNSYPTQSLISYPSPPNLIQNSPNFCTAYFLDYQPPVSRTNYYTPSSSSSYHSTLARGGDDDVFDEYDPDPYSGGYDIVQTYGNPLPPSAQTCYPRSAPNAAPGPEGVSCEAGAAAEGINKGGNETAWGSQVGNDGIRYYGSGLEGVDLCGGVFGYWPCWEKHQKKKKKKKKKGNFDFDQEKCDSSSSSSNGDDSPWNNCTSAADYLFGSPFGYGELISDYNYQQEYYY